MLQRIKTYKIQDLGTDTADCFSGASAFCTPYDEVAVGNGDNPIEAYNTALDVIAERDVDTADMPFRVKGLHKKDRVPADLLAADWQRYVAIFYTLKHVRK